MLEDLREITDRFIAKLKEEAGLDDHWSKEDMDHSSIESPAGASATTSKNHSGPNDDTQGGTDP